VLDSSGVYKGLVAPSCEEGNKPWGYKKNGCDVLPSFGISSSSSVALWLVYLAVASLLPGFRYISIFKS
jgi:hypothetical protein